MDNRAVIIEKRTVVLEKVRKNRKITTHKSWKNDIDYENEMEILSNIQSGANENSALLLQLIKCKLHSYKHQDKTKKKYNAEKFMISEKVIELMTEQKNKCYYCNENVIVFYEKVREPKQWTLERMNNDYGHNVDNCVISCLKCNVTRKTMYHARFKFTKELEIVKIN